MPRRFIWGCLLAGLAIGTAPAQEPEIRRDAADLKGGFRAFMAYDQRFDSKDDKNRQGKPHCMVCEYGLNPVLAVFARSLPKPQETDAPAPLVKLVELQEKLTETYAPQKLGAFVIFLRLTEAYEDDTTRIAKTEEIHKFGVDHKLKRVPLGLAEATVKDGELTVPPEKVKNFGIGSEDDITVIFYDRLKIVKRWKFAGDKGPSQADLKEIREVVEGHFKK